MNAGAKRECASVSKKLLSENIFISGGGIPCAMAALFTVYLYFTEGMLMPLEPRLAAYPDLVLADKTVPRVEFHLIPSCLINENNPADPNTINAPDTTKQEKSLK